MSEVDESFRPVVITPTFNNARTLDDVLRRVEALGVPIIVVNDGSTDATANILAQWKDRATIVTHDRNRGKAAALQTGFVAARDANFSHAVTIDTDGQLDPEQIPELLRVAEASPNAFVIGYRDETAADYPARSRFGRKFSNSMVKLESGASVHDSQCGLRVYPLGPMAKLRCTSGRFGFETEVITRVAWAGFEMREVPVRCRYLPLDQRVSHFKPWRDSIRALAMHARLLMRAMLPLPGNVKSDETLLRRLWNWISPLEAWRQVRENHANRNWFALSFAVGVFIANLPLYGVQTLVALYTAKRLHLQPLGVVAGSHVSTPPINVILIACAIAVGHFILHASWIVVDVANVKIASVIVDWIVGGVVLGIVTGAISFFAIGRLLKILDARDREEHGRDAHATASAVS